MAHIFKLQLSVFFIFIVASSARQLLSNPKSVAPLQSRLAAARNNGGVTQCWDSLLDLKSCSNEMVLFFINGDSYLSVDCCRAIVTITQRCWWTSMLSALGFTTSEIDVLRGYCGNGSSSDISLPPPPAIANAPASSTN